MESIMDFQLDFKMIEQEVFRSVCELGCRIIETTLETLDKGLAEERDKDEYRHRGSKKTSIKTIMGTVNYRRVVYEHYDESGSKSYVYLLDEFLNMETIGKISGMLVEKVLENVSIGSYRKSADNVTSITGQSISHGAVWGLVQKFGKKLQEEEMEKVEQFKAGNLLGEKEVDVLFMESDGLWLSMQGKDRPKEGSGKREIKIGVHYEGWVRCESGKKKAYKVKNKFAVAGFTDSESFKLIRDASIAEKYNYDEIKYKILNGDGASWIKSGHNNEGEYFQLDRFHIARAIVRTFKDKKEARSLWKMFKRCQFKSFMNRLTELKYECGGVYEEVKKIEALERYLISNKDGVVPYQQKVELPDPPEGLYYRNLGTMEHNVFDILGYRMKGQKMSWSINGANHLSKILAVKASGRLYEKIGSLLSSKLPDKALIVYETAIQQFKKRSSEIVKKIKLYPTQRGQIPFTGASKNEERKAIRELFEEVPASRLIYK